MDATQKRKSTCRPSQKQGRSRYPTGAISKQLNDGTALEYVHPLAPSLTNHYASNLGFADGNPPQRPRPEVQMANRDEREGTIQLRASFQMQKTLFGCLPPSSLSRSHGVFFPSLFDSGNLPPPTKHYSNSPLSTSKLFGCPVKASTAPARQNKASHRVAAPSPLLLYRSPTVYALLLTSPPWPPPWLDCSPCIAMAQNQSQWFTHHHCRPPSRAPCIAQTTNHPAMTAVLSRFPLSM